LKRQTVLWPFYRSSLFNSIDATAESGKLGRLANHSRKNANCRTRCVAILQMEPHLYLEATRTITVGEEILYDYGDRSTVTDFPWLAQ